MIHISVAWSESRIDHFASYHHGKAPSEVFGEPLHPHSAAYDHCSLLTSGGESPHPVVLLCIESLMALYAFEM